MADGGANQLFAGVVTGGGIDDIEAAIERAVEQLFDCARSDMLITDFRAAKAEHADCESGSAKPPRLHNHLPLPLAHSPLSIELRSHTSMPENPRGHDYFIS